MSWTSSVGVRVVVKEREEFPVPLLSKKELEEVQPNVAAAALSSSQRIAGTFIERLCGPVSPLARERFTIAHGSVMESFYDPSLAERIRHIYRAEESRITGMEPFLDRAFFYNRAVSSSSLSSEERRQLISHLFKTEGNRESGVIKKVDVNRVGKAVIEYLTGNEETVLGSRVDVFNFNPDVIYWSSEEVKYAKTHACNADVLKDICERKNIDLIIEEVAAKMPLKGSKRVLLLSSWGRLTGAWKERRDEEKKKRMMRETFIHAAGNGMTEVVDLFFEKAPVIGRNVLLMKIGAEALHAAVLGDKKETIASLSLRIKALSMVVRKEMLALPEKRGDSSRALRLLEDASARNYSALVKDLIDTGFYDRHAEAVDTALKTAIDRGNVAAAMVLLTTTNVHVRSKLSPMTVGLSVAYIAQNTAGRLTETMQAYKKMSKEEFLHAVVQAEALGFMQGRANILQVHNVQCHKGLRPFTATVVDVYKNAAVYGVIPVIENYLCKIGGNAELKNRYHVIFEQALLSNQQGIIASMLRYKDMLTTEQLQQTFYCAIRSGGISSVREFLYREEVTVSHQPPAPANETDMDIIPLWPPIAPRIEYVEEKTGITFDPYYAMLAALKSKNKDVFDEITSHVDLSAFKSLAMKDLLSYAAENGLEWALQAFLDAGCVRSHEGFAVIFSLALKHRHWEAAQFIVAHSQRQNFSVAKAWRERFFLCLERREEDDYYAMMKIGDSFGKEEIVVLFECLFDAKSEHYHMSLSVLDSLLKILEEPVVGSGKASFRFTEDLASMIISYECFGELVLIAMRKNRTSAGAPYVERLVHHCPAFFERNKHRLFVECLEKRSHNIEGYDGVKRLFLDEGHITEEFLDTCLPLVANRGYCVAYDVIAHKIKGYTPAIDRLKHCRDIARDCCRIGIIKALERDFVIAKEAEMRKNGIQGIRKRFSWYHEFLGVSFTGNIEVDIKILMPWKMKKMHLETFIEAVNKKGGYYYALYYYAIFPKDLGDSESFSKLCDCLIRAKAEEIKIIERTQKAYVVFKEAYEKLKATRPPEDRTPERCVTCNEDFLKLYAIAFSIAVKNDLDPHIIVDMYDRGEKFLKKDGNEGTKLHFMKALRDEFAAAGVPYDAMISKVEECRKKIRTEEDSNL
jgi:hypothetical protein